MIRMGLPDTSGPEKHDMFVVLDVETAIRGEHYLDTLISESLWYKKVDTLSQRRFEGPCRLVKSATQELFECLGGVSYPHTDITRGKGRLDVCGEPSSNHSDIETDARRLTDEKSLELID
jgi:hypothetical protein